ncbi:MAG: sulfur carrier protein ThiS [Clostridia bacterium]|nr:sulfur carrier protein ThiS [Clostridia bacterium]
MIFINGKEADFAGVTVTECLKQLNYSTDRIAIEFNGDILPKAKYGETLLSDGDKIEIVHFVGGG